jgi:hypothetical protein
VKQLLGGRSLLSSERLVGLHHARNTNAIAERRVCGGIDCPRQAKRLPAEAQRRNPAQRRPSEAPNVQQIALVGLAALRSVAPFVEDIAVRAAANHDHFRQ